MRRLNGAEIGAVVLGAALILGGAFVALFPSEFDILHPGHHGRGVRAGPILEHVSKNKQRATGGCAILMGTGIFWLGLYRGTGKDE